MSIIAYVGLALIFVGGVGTGVLCAVIQLRAGFNWAALVCLIGVAASTAASTALILAGTT